MQQKRKFWIALIAIVLVCFIDYQLFTEGYAVRGISPIYRQVAHLVVLVAVVPIGYWAWKSHPMQWLKTLWLLSYSVVILFIVLVGGLKTLDVLNNDDFLDWATTVRYLFCGPLPHILIYMLSLIAVKQKADN